jgi:hypothetical protein
MMLREIPEGSGIHGRPILERDQPGNERHLAFHRKGDWWTWCYKRVPSDHRCPDREEIASSWPHYVRNCEECHRNYKALNGQPWPEPKTQKTPA